MKLITQKTDIEIYWSRLLDFYFEGMKAGTLDIETTGLSATRNKFVLGGLYTFHDKEFCQFFAETEMEEEEALIRYIDRLSELDVVVTYNGRHFDMPFIFSRYRRITGRDYAGHVPYNLDIYLLLNGHSPVKHFVPNLKQKTVENYMGLWTERSDRIDGGQSVEMYKEYERTKDPVLGETILLHNSDDVLQLARLLKIVSKCDMHKAMFKCGFPVGNLTVSKIHTGRDRMEITGIQRDIPLSYCCYDIDGFPAYVNFDSAAKDFTVHIPLIRRQGMALIDLMAAGMDAAPFEMYPECSSGFLVVESNSAPNHMVINHFIKVFMKRVIEIIERN